MPRAKYELQYSLRSHYAANDSAFGCMGVKEDEEGKQGVYLKKEVVSVAQKCLNLHIRKVAPHILPISELVSHQLVDSFLASAQMILSTSANCHSLSKRRDGWLARFLTEALKKAI